MAVTQEQMFHPQLELPMYNKIQTHSFLHLKIQLGLLNHVLSDQDNYYTIKLKYFFRFKLCNMFNRFHGTSLAWHYVSNGFNYEYYEYRTTYSCYNISKAAVLF